MEFDLKEFLRLKDLAASKRRALDRAQGERDALISQLQKEYACESIEQAEKLLAKLQRKKEALTSEINDKMVAYQQTYGDK